ncbi:hypothetical protein HDV02_004896 [Globomyces sp. JEL0801]|nr:hypothetical protein HDV02_004896 [Globomyces sp. JEL0801]
MPSIDLKESFLKFLDTTEPLEMIDIFESIRTITPTYESLKEKVLPMLPYSKKSLFTILDKRFSRYEKVTVPSNILISGGGPCGLRAAVEAAMLGHQVTLIELRTLFSRHNVLKMFSNLTEDLMDFGLKIWIPTFKPHGHSHIGTKELQLVLLKVALMLQVKVHFGFGVCGIIDPIMLKTINMEQSNLKGLDQHKWKVWTLPTDQAKQYLKLKASKVVELDDLTPGETDIYQFEKISKVDYFEKYLSKDGAIIRHPFENETEWNLFHQSKIIDFDSLIVAEGESSKLIRNLGFDRKLQRFSQAIGIVINMNFSKTVKENKLQEFVLTRQSALWKSTALGPLADQNLKLESLEYMRGTTNHFFAAATKIKELKEYGVIAEVKSTVKETLQADNVNFDKLREMGRLIAKVCGVHQDAEYCDKNGIQMFDFSARGVCVQTHQWLNSVDEHVMDALVVPVGDTFQNPYWPQGLGINRGFHSAIDGVWAAHLSAISNGDKQLVDGERKNAFLTSEWSVFMDNTVISGHEWKTDPLYRYHPALFLSRYNNETAIQTLPPRFVDAVLKKDQ